MATVEQTAHWIPRLCTPLGLLRSVLLSLVISCMLALMRQGTAGFAPLSFGPLALWVLWLTLLSTFWLCLLNRWQTLFSSWLIATLALGGIPALAWLSSWVFNWWFASMGLAGAWILASPLENALLALLIAAVVLRFLAVHAQLQAQQSQLGRARFDALQARMQPHFLFNTLNSIAALIPRRPRDAENAVLDLSDILRSSLGKAQDSWRLVDEIQLCEQYLSLEKLRLEERLDWRIDTEGELAELPFPQFALQTLVENAVLHGIEPLESGGMVRLTVQRHGGRLKIRVSNPLPRSPGRPGNGQALANTRARLDASFERVVQFDHGQQDGQYLVEIEVSL